MRVGEIREDRAVAGEQELARVVPAEAAGVHLTLEEVGAAVEERPQQDCELLAEDRSALERFPTNQPHEVGVLLEEAERGAQHALDLRPTFAGPSIALSTSSTQSAKESSTTARYSASFDGKWCSRLGRRMPTSSAISLRLVPA